MKSFGCVLLLLLTPFVSGAEIVADPEIRHLLDGIGGSGCQFERNGRLYDAVAAADHLAMKYSRARRHIDDAESFIEVVGTRSSFSGKPYEVVCADRTTPSQAWLLEVLENYRRADERGV